FFKMLDPDFTPMPVYAAMKQQANRPPVVYPGYFQEDHWAIQAAGQWTLVSDPRAVLGKYRRSTQAGDSLSFSFAGTRLDAVFVRGPQGGAAQVTLDDRAPVEVALTASTDAFGQPTTIASGVPAGIHRVQIKAWTSGVGFDGLIVFRETCRPREPTIHLGRHTRSSAPAQTVAGEHKHNRKRFP